MNLCSDLIPFLNTYFGESVITPNIAIPLYNMSYYAKFLIEIAIVVDRILMLVPSFGSRWGINNLLKVQRPYLILLGLCTFSLLINWPYLYLIDGAKVNVFISYPDRTVYTVYAAYTNSAWSKLPSFGYYVMIFIFIFKHVVTFTVETVFNVISLILFQRHLANKAKILGPSPSAGLASVSKPNLSINKTGSVMPIKRASRGMSLGNALTGNSGNNDPSAGGRKMANLVLIMSVTGFAHNAILLTYTVCNLTLPLSVFLRSLNFLAYFTSALRHAINFLQFYLFNTAFRKETRFILAKLKIISHESG
jgi:hypothetical protein